MLAHEGSDITQDPVRVLASLGTGEQLPKRLGQQGPARLQHESGGDLSSIGHGSNILQVLEHIKNVSLRWRF
jgi:hypothetical protein